MEAGQNPPEWKWHKKRVEAAQLTAEDELTVTEIAARLDIDRKTLFAWRQRPEFQGRVKELQAEMGAAAERYAIGKRIRRVRNLNDRLERLHQVMRDRAADPAMQDVPGGRTGLLVRDVKGIGGGDNLRVVELYSVDVGLLKELREHEKQAAMELGQWVERTMVDVRQVDEAIARELERVAGGGEAGDAEETPAPAVGGAGGEAGALPGGPEPTDDGGGDGPGPVADGPPALDIG